MRNLISFNSSFIWNDKNMDRNSCINNFNLCYLEAKEQDSFYIKQDLHMSANSIIREMHLFKSFDEMKITFPWLTPDSYNLLSTLLQIKKTLVISDVITAYNTNHDFPFSSWMGFCEQNETNYVFNINSWNSVHHEFVMNFTKRQRLNNHKYFQKFAVGLLKEAPRDIRKKIKNGTYKYFERIDIPQEADGKAMHSQKIHIHLKDDGALNIDGSIKHPIRRISTKASNDLIEIGFILPENL